MAARHPDSTRFLMTAHRLQALTDGIFAIAMTLLVLAIDLPGKGRDHIHLGLPGFLARHVQDFFNYALGFVLLAIFWLIHHQQFHFIRGVDRVLIWINIFMLMAVGVVPFTTSLVGNYPAETLAEFIFAVNMFVIGALFFWNWAYASKGRRLVDPQMSEAHVRAIRNRGLVLPCVSIVAAALSTVGPLLASYSYLAAPVILFLRPFDTRRGAAGSRAGAGAAPTAGGEDG